MSDDNPWTFLQPNDVERFGAGILDPDEQRRWSGAIFLGGLSYMWQKATVLRDLIFLKLDLQPGERVLLIGEALQGSKFPEDIRARIGGGELTCIDFIEDARNAMAANRAGRTGIRGTWEYTYTHAMPNDHFDVIFCHQGIGHSEDWSVTAREFVRVLKPGGKIMLTEIGFGPQFLAALQMDLHVEYIFRKIFAGRHRTIGDAAYYSMPEIAAAFHGLLSGSDSFSWRSAELFWGRKRV